MTRSTRDRIVDLHARLEPLRVVVGHLVRRDVRPHLQHAGPDVARARARHRHAQRDGRRSRRPQPPRDAAGAAAGARPGRRLRRRRAPTPRLAGLSTGAQCGEYRFGSGPQRTEARGAATRYGPRRDGSEGEAGAGEGAAAPAENPWRRFATWSGIADPDADARLDEEPGDDDGASRGPTWLPVALLFALYGLAVLIYILLGRGQALPQVAPDEYQYSALARSRRGRQRPDVQRRPDHRADCGPRSTSTRSPRRGS